MALKPIEILKDTIESVAHRIEIDSVVSLGSNQYRINTCNTLYLRTYKKVTIDGVEYEVEPGDCVFTPMGSEHEIIAITDCVEFWCELEYRGRKRRGHLHRGDDD